MPAEIKTLRGIDKQVVAYGTLLLLAVATAAGMAWHLGVLRAELAERQAELSQKEIEAQSIVLPSDDERREWTTQQNLTATRLLADAELANFFGEISRQFTLNQLERFNLSSEEYIVGEGELSENDSLMQAVGIRRYEVITLQFSGGYRNVAQFIQALGRLPRLAEFVSIQLRRNQPAVDVTMTFRVYKSEAAD